MECSSAYSVGFLLGLPRDFTLAARGSIAVISDATGFYKISQRINLAALAMAEIIATSIALMADD